MMNNDILRVGSTVRLPRPEVNKTKGTATIATLQDDNDKTTACVLWEPIAPQPLPGPILMSLRKRRLKRRFLVTPLIIEDDNDDEEEEERETIAEVSSLTPLLDFELKAVAAGGDDNVLSAEEWKAYGDQLLKLGDASKACSYYERSLQVSSILQVGSTIIVKDGGWCKLADLYCLDDDEIEVTMLASASASGDDEEERVIGENDILLCILHNDENHLQERILLNLARCLLQLGDLVKHIPTMASERRSQYLRGAVLATTLAITIAEHHVNNNNNNKKDEDKSSSLLATTKLAQTALLLRGQAQAGLGKYQNAVSDTKKLLQAVPNHKEATKQLRSLEGQQRKQKSIDKKLVKSMCSWVQKATTDGGDPVSSNIGGGSSSSSDPATVVINKDASLADQQVVSGMRTPPTTKRTDKAENNCFSHDNVTNTYSSSSVAPETIMMAPRNLLFLFIVIPLMIAFLLQQILG